jgi:tRNA threonylcarbamoyladenosine biosynthesis protein TsaE
MKTEYRLGLSEAKSFARTLAPKLAGGEILALVGQLGSGKTTFTQALGRALGVRQKILSPTFIVLQEFPTRLRTKAGQKVVLSHLDLYRVKNFKEAAAVGLDQTWGKPNSITVIEWADKIKTRLPKQTIYIYLTRDVI